MIVLDASALLALLFREPGAERVAASLAQAGRSPRLYSVSPRSGSRGSRWSAAFLR